MRSACLRFRIVSYGRAEISYRTFDTASVAARIDFKRLKRSRPACGPITVTSLLYHSLTFPTASNPVTGCTCTRCSDASHGNQRSRLTTSMSPSPPSASHCPKSLQLGRASRKILRSQHGVTSRPFLQLRLLVSDALRNGTGYLINSPRLPTIASKASMAPAASLAQQIRPEALAGWSSPSPVSVAKSVYLWPTHR